MPEQLTVSSEFQQAFYKVYPHAYGDGEKREQFISLLRDTVETNKLGEFKFVVYSLREIGTHASIDPSGQMADFSKWLKETDVGNIQTHRKYNNMLADLIKPENLPIFDTKAPLSEASSVDRGNRETLADVLYANLLIIRETGLTRQAAQDSAMAFLESDISDVEIDKNQPGHAQYLATNMIINNQNDRHLLPIWEAILHGKDLVGKNRAEQKLLKQPFHMGFHGLMSLPTVDGDFNQIAFDVAPQALKAYVQIVDKLGGEKQEWFSFSLLGYRKENRLREFERLLQMADFQNWPKWAKEQVREWDK